MFFPLTFLYTFLSYALLVSSVVSPERPADFQRVKTIQCTGGLSGETQWFTINQLEETAKQGCKDYISAEKCVLRTSACLPGLRKKLPSSYTGSDLKKKDGLYLQKKLKVSSKNSWGNYYVVIRMEPANKNTCELMGAVILASKNSYISCTRLLSRKTIAPFIHDAKFSPANGDYTPRVAGRNV
ncbi:hypothetical protein K3495_g14193 [Podosphaera aphanis]|nr:hypothetical protein K3495_g14193 [Podosphaera aphanis]